MLSLLHIENIAVIESADISFDRGFNVLTGETGAGKSIVIDAISAVLGERAYRDMIRTGSAKASVRAVFTDVPEYPWFSENGVDYDPEKRAAFSIMCDLFGGGPYSRLFTNVREKMSLCYYCSARLNSDKGIMLIQSGIETENREKALSAIKEQFEIVKNDRFEDDELEASKKACADALDGFGDTPEDYDYWCMNQMLRDKIITPGELAEKIREVTREDVVNCAGKVTLDTVYMLEGTGEAEE